MQSKGQRPKLGATPATPPGRTTRVSKKSTAVSGVLPTLRSRRDRAQVHKIALTQVRKIALGGSIDRAAGASNKSKIALGGTIDGAAEASKVRKIALGITISLFFPQASDHYQDCQGGYSEILLLVDVQ